MNKLYFGDNLQIPRVTDGQHVCPIGTDLLLNQDRDIL